MARQLVCFSQCTVVSDTQRPSSRHWPCGCCCSSRDSVLLPPPLEMMLLGVTATMESVEDAMLPLLLLLLPLPVPLLLLLSVGTAFVLCARQIKMAKLMDQKMPTNPPRSPLSTLPPSLCPCRRRRPRRCWIFLQFLPDICRFVSFAISLSAC